MTTLYDHDEEGNEWEFTQRGEHDDFEYHAATQALFLNGGQLLETCPSACALHSRAIKNLLEIMAQKNLGLSRRMLHTAPRLIRARLVSYLSQQAIRQGSDQFTIPFNRQQLADYLSVDRSALSSELSKMQKDGLLTYEKNTFHLRRTNLES